MTTFSNAIIVGASGGIGAALSARLEADGTRVARLSRRSDPPLDLADEQGIAAAAAVLARRAPFDLVIVAAGLLHDSRFGPERRAADLNAAQLSAYFQVNAIGPALVARHFLPLMPRDARSAFAALSARVGSIGDNRLGGWYGYRASKAALNQLIATLSIEVRRTHPAMVVAALHPGTVDTPLSRPFQRNLAPGQLLTATDSASGLLRVLQGLGPDDSGGHFDWRGQRIVP